MHEWFIGGAYMSLNHVALLALMGLRSSQPDRQLATRIPAIYNYLTLPFSYLIETYLAF